MQNIGYPSYIITLSALSTVFDALEYTAFTSFCMKDAAMIYSASLRSLRLSIEKKPRKVTINVDDVMKDDSTDEQRKLSEKRRYIAVCNRKREELDLSDLSDKIDIVKKKISEIQDQKELKKSMGKLKSLVKFTENNTALNEERINVLTKLAGRFLLVTNTDLQKDEIVTAYKEQWEIERSFRTIKSFLEIRPVYHRKPDRIKAHVFVCVLSLLLSSLIEKKTKITISEAGRILSYLKVTPVQLESGVAMVRSESEQGTGPPQSDEYSIPGENPGWCTDKKELNSTEKQCYTA